MRDYASLYKKVFKVLGELTPLKVNCGQLCGGACCKGDENTGMRLFPHEESTLEIRTSESGGRLAVCSGSCNRDERPLSCRIFPFFPTIDEKGRIFAELDQRAARLCPMVAHADDIEFDRRFIRAVKKVGKLLARDEECRSFLYDVTEEIDLYSEFLENK